MLRINVTTLIEQKQVLQFIENEILKQTDPLAIIKRITGGLRPSRIRVEINDKLAKVIFKLSDEGTDELLGGKTFEIVEKRGKKFGEITTAYKILNAAGYQVLRPFTMFDRFVLAVCISEWLKGNRYTTVAIIYRALTGKIGRSDAKPSVAQRKAIIESLEILMSRIVDYGQKTFAKSWATITAILLLARLLCCPLLTLTFLHPTATMIL